MSLKDLDKYIKSNPVIRPLNQKNRTLIVVSDSKGSRLQNCVGASSPESEIVWKVKGGRNSYHAASFIEENLHSFVETYQYILLVVWTGTCDLTNFIDQFHYYRPGYRRRRYIDLSNITVHDIIGQYHRILSVTSNYGQRVRVIFLECPQYSIQNWNENQGHPNPIAFAQNTDVLLGRIQQLNFQIQNLNHSVSGIIAPKFGLDLLKRRKSNKSYYSTKVSFSLLADGIHPGTLLSQYWLRRLVLTLLVPYCHI